MEYTLRTFGSKYQFHIDLSRINEIPESKTWYTIQYSFCKHYVPTVRLSMQDMHAHLCGKENPGLCSAMNKIDGDQLKQYLLKVRFKGERYIYAIPFFLWLM